MDDSRRAQQLERQETVLRIVIGREWIAFGALVHESKLTALQVRQILRSFESDGVVEQSRDGEYAPTTAAKRIRDLLVWPR